MLRWKFIAVSMFSLLVGSGVAFSLPGVEMVESISGFTVNSHESTRYYEVSGDTSAEIFSELRGSANPLAELPGVGRKPFGNVSLTYSYSYQPGLAAGAAGCKVVSGSMDVRYQTVLPSLKDFDKKPERLQDKWRSFQQVIAEHEAGHVELLRRVSRQLPRVLGSIDADSCSDLERKIEMAVLRLERRIEQASSDYDTRPHHDHFASAAR